MASELRVGFIGCGSHAVMNLYPCLMYAPVRLVSVCDKNEERLGKVKRNFGAETAFVSVEQMLSGPEIEAVFVCGPPELHRTAALTALDQGLHVFVEKPPADDLAGTLEIERVARANGRHCGVGFMKRFALRYRQAKDIMRSESFGRTTQITIKYSHWSAPNVHWMLSYMTVHLFDLARFFAGDLERITVETIESGGQQSFSAVARAKSGALVSMITSSQEPRVKEYVEVVGEGELLIVRNVVELEYHRHVEPSKYFSPQIHDVDVLRPDFAIPGTNENTLFLQGYAGEIIDFAQSILADRAPAVTIDDGVMAMRFMDLFENQTSGTFVVKDWA